MDSVQQALENSQSIAQNDPQQSTLLSVQLTLILVNKHNWSRWFLMDS